MGRISLLKRGCCRNNAFVRFRPAIPFFLFAVAIPFLAACKPRAVSPVVEASPSTLPAVKAPTDKKTSPSPPSPASAPRKEILCVTKPFSVADDSGIYGFPVGTRVTLVCADGDELTVDLSGCSPQVMGPSNATLSSTCSTVFYALIASADVPIAANAGCYRPVKIVAPPGLCVSAAVPAPVVHRIAIGHRLATVLFGVVRRVR